MIKTTNVEFIGTRYMFNDYGVYDKGFKEKYYEFRVKDNPKARFFLKNFQFGIAELYMFEGSEIHLCLEPLLGCFNEDSNVGIEFSKVVNQEKENLFTQAPFLTAFKCVFQKVPIVITRQNLNKEDIMEAIVKGVKRYNARNYMLQYALDEYLKLSSNNAD